MSLGAIIYRILIGPLELLFEVIFVIADRHVTNPAYAIIFLSLAMNFLVLPLYKRADAVQAEARDKEKAMAPWVKHIRKTFKGDERFMMLQAFYRENNYKPTDSLKGSISLLLEIPFFIAAYHFLSNLPTLRGVSFGPITDLGSPDALLTIGTITLNLLPILMTLINVISAAIYMRGFPLKSKVQMYGIAAIFLVFLYKSPSGLVFYWTLNNIFSLIKNIFYKIPNPEKILKIMASVTGAVLLVLVIFVHPMSSTRAQVLAIAGLLCLQIPMLKGNRTFNIGPVDSKEAAKVFYASEIFLTILTGILIPSSVIGDSTEEFISIANYYSPYWYIVSAFTIAFGTFIVWLTIFYRLASKEGKLLFSLLMVICSAVAAVDYMFFGKGYGNFSSVLVYDIFPSIQLNSLLANAAVIIVLAVAIYFIFIKNLSIIKALSVAMCLALIVMAFINITDIQRTLSETAPIIEAARDGEPEINLSKKGKNVVVIMMDRQIGHFVPFIMHEKPELKESFSGFTNYSNSFSYGTFTNVGAPGIYGGYDYIPAEMNKRDDMILEDKHNEALKVMPKLFLDAGYNVSVFDPPYAGYMWISDLSIYDDLPEVNACIAKGKFSLSELSYKPRDENEKKLRNRNFFMYSIFKTMPLILQHTVYSNGTYNSPEVEERKPQQEIISDTEAEGMKEGFLSSYAELCHLPEITKVSEADTGEFLMMCNDLTHEPMLLQEPEFVPAEHVSNNKNDPGYYHKKDDEGNELILEDQNTLIHYQINVAAMLKLGEWMDDLREKGVYDNTRIIIVSDHGRDMVDNIAPILDYTSEERGEQKLWTAFFDSVLMVKDFNAEGFNSNDDLISNADTPAMATEGIIQDPHNPYTGNQISRFADQDAEPELIYTFDFHTDKNNGKKLLPSDWFTVKGNIYNKKNWKYLGYY